MKRKLVSVLCSVTAFAIAVVGMVDISRGEETITNQQGPRSDRPSTSSSPGQRSRESRAADYRRRDEAVVDAPLTDSPQSQVELTVWELTFSNAPKEAEADSKSDAASAAPSLPTEFASLKEVREFIKGLQDSGRLQSLREVRLLALDGQASRLQLGADRPQIVGANLTQMGRTNTIQYRSIGTLIEIVPRIDKERQILLQLDYNASNMAKAEDVPLFEAKEGKDGTSRYASNIVTRQLKTATKLKNGGAAIVQADSTSVLADKSTAGETVLIILGGSIGQAAGKASQ